ncbi:MAG: hypothetical protein WCA32_08470 [Chromatiaceae bacterium]
MDEATLHCTMGIGIWDWASAGQRAVARPARRRLRQPVHTR